MKTFSIRCLSIATASFLICGALASCDIISNIALESLQSSSVESNTEESVTTAPIYGDITSSETTVSATEESKSEETFSSNMVESGETESTNTEASETTAITDSESNSQESSNHQSSSSEPEASESTESSDEAFDENGRFDYLNSNMDKYIAVDEELYKNTTVTLPSYLDGSDKAIKEYIDILLKQNSVSTGEKITDRAIQNGDVVALYYEGWLDGEKFEGGSNMDDKTPYSLTIGSGTFIPGFEEALIGIVPSETSREKLVDLHLTFPENYHSADLAGKAVIFKVYVEYIEEYAPAEYTDKFITNTLGYYTTATDIKADFERYLKDKYLPYIRDNEISNAIWNKMTEGAVIKTYPKGELEYYMDSYESQYKQYYQYYSSMFSSYEEFMKAYLGTNWKTDLEEQCKIDVEQSLIFHYIAQKEGLTITETDYKNAVQYYIDYYASQGTTLTEADVEKYFGERMIKEQALWDNVNKLLIEGCTAIYE